MQTYIDGYGKEHIPGPDSLIMPRRGIFAVCIAKEHILLSWPVWAPDRPELPGGGIDPGEDLEQALRREIHEETGVLYEAVSPLQEHTQEIHLYAEDTDRFLDYHQTFWLIDPAATDKGFFEGVQKPADALKAMWVKLADLKDLPIHAMHARALRALKIL